VRSRDTSPEIYELQLQIYRSMSPARRVEIGMEMSEEAFDIAAAGISTHHPDYDKTQVSWALRRLRLGDRLFRAVWPDAPLLAP
jgi:hypothetical protein